MQSYIENLKPIQGLKVRRFFSGLVCAGLLVLLFRVDLGTKWGTPGPKAIGEEATERIGEHLFTDYLLPFEVASVLLLMAMIGAIVLARRDVLQDISNSEDNFSQNIINNSNESVLIDQSQD